MISITLFGVSLGVGILAGADSLALPDPLIPALLGVALLAVAASIKRKTGWR
jgi:hypothetical protein